MLKTKILDFICIAAGAALLVAVYAAPMFVKGTE